MRLLLLCDPYSSHSQKWISSLAEKGAEIFVVSLKNATQLNLPGAKEIISLTNNDSLDSAEEGSFRKLNYLFNVWRVKKIIKQIKPDIVHAYYASSYGALGALTNFHPYFISVWGSDVMSFPQKGFLKRSLLRFALSRADRIFATSKLLIEVTKQFVNKKISQIPFGINLSKFKVGDKTNAISTNRFVIGSVKNLEYNYGIDYLIKIFAKLKEQNSNKNLKLMIIGDGKDREAFANLVKKLNVEDAVDFIGFVRHDELPKYYGQMDLFANLSLRESFGVSVLEASASGIPIIVSNIDGLKEVCQNEITGLIVDLKNENNCVEKFQRFIDDAALRNKMGSNGRAFVENNYDWNLSVEKMWNMYAEELVHKK